MAIISEHIRNFSQNVPPNTFIGGIAKIGGTGVNAPIDTPTKLANKLGININRVSGFKVKGNNVEVRIKGSYTMGSFGALNQVDANQNITYFYDNEGLVSAMQSHYAFRYCVNFSDFKFSSNLLLISNDAFSYTSIVHADLSYLTSATTGEWGNMFRFCLELLSANTGELGTTGLGQGQIFFNCPKLQLENVTTKVRFYNQMFRASGSVSGTFNNPYVLELNSFSFSHTNRAENVYLPNCVRFRNEEFYRGTAAQGNFLKQVVAPKVTAIGVNGGNGSCFVKNHALELLDIRACKFFYGTVSFTDSMKAGGIIKVHIFMATSNAGGANAELVYLKTTRGVTVQFYDDAGNYVSTL